MFDDHFRKAQELRAAGVPFATAVVVRAQKPTSGKPGDRAIVTRDGTLYGWVGGSCAQPTVIEEALRAIRDGESRLIRLSPEPGKNPVPDGIEEVPMTCFSGGTLDIFIEPHQPAPHLLIIGSLPVAQSLAHLGKALQYRVTAVDMTGSSAMDHADDVLHALDDIAKHVTPLTFAVVATHGDYDEPALKAILETQAPYVGLIASHKRGQAVMASLELDGVSEADCARVRYPAGLDIQARRGDEIAVSILAEIVQARRAIVAIDWDEGSEDKSVHRHRPHNDTAHEHGSREGSAAEPTAHQHAPRDDAAQPLVTLGALGESVRLDAPETAIDPVCQMTVMIEGALHTYEHDGETYYFCCRGCRTRFMKNPAKFLASEGAVE